MRTHTTILALLTTAMMTPAIADNHGHWYTGIKGGPAFLLDGTFKDSNTKDVEVKTDNKTGFAIGGVVGYDWGALRTEFELGFIKNKAYPYLFGTDIEDTADGTNKVFNYMINLLYDVPLNDEDLWTGYIGVGAGGAQVKYSGYQTSTNGTFSRLEDFNYDHVPAWQVLVGVRRELTDNLDFTIGYKYFSSFKTTTDGYDLDTSFPFESKLQGHIGEIGLRYNFGKEAPPPPPPPPPPPTPQAPPPPPPVQQVERGPFIIFFDHDKSEITASAEDILGRVVEVVKMGHAAELDLQGFADTSGRKRYNQGLSERRVKAAKAYLIEKGIDASRIVTSAFGETKLRVETADNVREPQNRRVEIRLP